MVGATEYTAVCWVERSNLGVRATESLNYIQQTLVAKSLWNSQVRRIS